ncbi:PREDICTED: run domain Beclin-1 interacting and cysteine-rich containing protein-like [Priapulus caudatus]|uniref:Run domain Beclin-1 interacting and cysteine-rich containing protein-like n=1 Tax=Priapulus caudatus TaxID=37621 RepID=A0ABM1FA11_PRICU|nr:PREDICTED: run domain Beclin-1 interacting and cysteine-rich containing protein-like [Priapulus caudatus]
MSETEEGRDCETLLVGLKSTAERLLANNSGGIWKVYGGLGRLTRSVENILNHGLKEETGARNGYWPFVSEQRWLHPMLADSVHTAEKAAAAGDGGSTVGLAWVEQSLLAYNLSLQLRMLVSSKENLRSYYGDGAFLCQEACAEAALNCLAALEENRPEKLAYVNTSFLASRAVKTKSPKRRQRHRRSASLPVNRLAQPSSVDGLLSIREQPSPALSRKVPHVSLRFHDDLAESAPLPTAGLKSEATDVLLSVYASPLRPCVDGAFSFYNVKSSDSLSDYFGDRTTTAWNEPMGEATRPGSDAGAARRRDAVDGRRRETIAGGELDGHSESESGAESRKSGTSPESRLIGSPVGAGASGENRRTRANFTRFSCSDSPPATPTTIREGSREVAATRARSKVGEPPPRARDAAFKTRHLSIDETEEEELAFYVDPAAPDESDNGAPYRDDDDAGAPCEFTLGGGAAAAYLRRPLEGQSLMSYLASQDFATCSNLVRENAHFGISEALIAAIEQMKCNAAARRRPGDPDEEEEESDEEIQELKQRIRIRRRERLCESRGGAAGMPLLSDGRTDSGGATSTSASPRSTSEGSRAGSSSSEGGSSDGVDLLLNEEKEREKEKGGSARRRTNLARMQESGFSLSMASMYSDADFQRPSSDSIGSVERYQFPSSEPASRSADSVAISLLRRFKQRRLPKASDLEWLVSERDAPQTLLPLPQSWPVSPDDGETTENQKRVRMRGNLEWAPPRAQIIFSIHPSPKRKVIMAKQNYRCAGCGTKIELNYIKRYRYCEYTGKYFCQCCHSNQLSIIPGRILRKWEFSKYPVSHFANELIHNIFRDPLFNVQDINATLYRKVRAMSSVCEYRQQLCHLKDYVSTCRHVGSLKEEFRDQPQHLLCELHTFSLRDLLKVKCGDLVSTLKHLTKEAQSHVYSCQLCHVKGFICEFCQDSSSIIYPFELKKVTQCHLCGTCFHKKCYVAQRCPRCERIQARKEKTLLKQQQAPEYSSSSSEN